MKGTARSLLLGSILVSAIGFSACSDDSDDPQAVGGSDSGGASTDTGGAKATGGTKAGGGSSATGGTKAGGGSGTGGSGATGGKSGGGGAAAGGAAAGGAAAGGVAGTATGGTTPTGAGTAGVAGKATGGTTQVAGAGGASAGTAGTTTPGTAGTTNNAGAGGTAGAAGAAGAGHSGLAKLFVPLSVLNPTGAAGAAGAAGATATEPNRNTNFEVDFGSAVADAKDFTSGTVTMLVKVLSSGNSGSLIFYLKNDTSYAQANIKATGAANEWISFASLKDWTSVTFDVSTVTGSGSFDKTKIRWFGINVYGGTGDASSVWGDTTVLIDSIRFSGFSGSQTFVDQTFDATYQNMTMSGYKPVAGSSVAWGATE